jgi:hypothetical protein
MNIVHARFTGQVFVPDEPIDLVEGERVELAVHRCGGTASIAVDVLSQLPLIHLSPEDAEAINRDPDFDIEES